MEIWIVMMKIKLVVTPQWNQATTVSFTEIRERGSTNAVNIIIAAVRERG